MFWRTQIPPLKELCGNLFSKNLDAPYAGSRIKFARRNFFLLSIFFLRNLKSRKSPISGNPFYCDHSLGMWSGFINPPNIWKVLPQKENYKEKPRGWSVVKCREFEGKICWNELCPFHGFSGFTLNFFLRIRILGRVWRRLFEQIWSCDRRDSPFPKRWGSKGLPRMKSDWETESARFLFRWIFWKETCNQTFHVPSSIPMIMSCLMSSRIGLTIRAWRSAFFCMYVYTQDLNLNFRVFVCACISYIIYVS